VVGKMSGLKNDVLQIEKEIEAQFTEETRQSLGQKWFGVKPVLGVASGGVHPGMVEKIIKMMGKDIVIQAGGGIHGHPLGTTAGSRAMRQAIDAVMENKDLKEYSKTHRELAISLPLWK